MVPLTIVLIAILIAGTVAYRFGMDNREPRGIAIVLVGALVLISILYFLSIFTVEQLVVGYISEIARATGISEYLAQALSIGLILPVIFGVSLLFSASRRKRLAGESLLAAFLVAYYGTLWLATKEQFTRKRASH